MFFKGCSHLIVTVSKTYADAMLYVWSKLWRLLVTIRVYLGLFIQVGVVDSCR